MNTATTNRLGSVSQASEKQTLKLDLTPPARRRVPSPELLELFELAKNSVDVLPFGGAFWVPQKQASSVLKYLQEQYPEIVFGLYNIPEAPDQRRIYKLKLKSKK